MKYKIIYADPPWQYNDSGVRGGVDHHYRTMSLEQIKKLPIEKIAAEDSTLFLWVTWPFLFEAKQVMKAWGFTYKTVAFVWFKKNTKADTLFMGCGHWTRSNSEVCLLAVRGKPKRKSASVRQVVVSKRKRHSQKPAAVRKRIVELMGNLPRVELFARKKVKNWHVWGNEVEGSISL